LIERARGEAKIKIAKHLQQKVPGYMFVAVAIKQRPVKIRIMTLSPIAVLSAAACYNFLSIPNKE
jgi:hypothetical protein